MLLVIGLVAAGGFVGWILGHYTGRATTHTVTVAAGTAPAAAGGGNVATGKQVFVSAGCGGCHTLKAAGASGTVGPDLDQKKPSLALVLQRVTNGKGAMPPFKSELTQQQVKDVAAFVVASTSGPAG